MWCGKKIFNYYVNKVDSPHLWIYDEKNNNMLQKNETLRSKKVLIVETWKKEL
jgi:hypothetical protein